MVYTVNFLLGSEVRKSNLLLPPNSLTHLNVSKIPNKAVANSF